MQTVPWDAGTWTHPPAHASLTPDGLVATAVEGSDAWRVTSYGFVHDTEHALLQPFATGSAVEVEFTVDLSQQFDQAGVFLRVGPEHWIKAGVEYSDGVPQLGVVVTDGRSDWSAAPVRGWAGRRATLRASRSGDALAIRAKAAGEPYRFVRLLPLDARLDVHAGPYLCAPTRAGLTITFHAWRITPADTSLHDEPEAEPATPRRRTAGGATGWRPSEV